MLHFWFTVFSCMFVTTNQMNWFTTFACLHFLKQSSKNLFLLISSVICYFRFRKQVKESEMLWALDKPTKQFRSIFSSFIQIRATTSMTAFLSPNYSLVCLVSLRVERFNLGLALRCGLANLNNVSRIKLQLIFLISRCSGSWSVPCHSMLFTIAYG